MGKYRNPYKRYGKNAAAAKESKSAVSRLILRIVNILPSGAHFCRAAPLNRAYVILLYCTIFFRTSQQGTVTFKTKTITLGDLNTTRVVFILSIPMLFLLFTSRRVGARLSTPKKKKIFTQTGAIKRVPTKRKTFCGIKEEQRSG